jgi:hypothetical protein
VELYRRDGWRDGLILLGGRSSRMMADLIGNGWVLVAAPIKQSAFKQCIRHGMRGSRCVLVVAVQADAGGPVQQMRPGSYD